MDMLKLFKNYPKELELVTKLSPSNITHPILQTVMDQCVDLVILILALMIKLFKNFQCRFEQG